MSGAASFLGLLGVLGFFGAGGEQASLELARHQCDVGDRVELTVAVDAEPGEELRFAQAPQLEPALAVVERRLVAATDAQRRATMTLALVACERGVVPIGPFALELRGAGRSRAISTDTTKLDVAAPWSGRTPPPFGAWRLPPSAATSSWRWIAAIAGALLVSVVAARLLLSRRRATPTSSATTAAGAPDRAAWRRLLDLEADATVAARREWCLAAHALVRAELARRSRAAAFHWSREELVAGRGLGAWSKGDAAAWERLLADLERGIYARDSLADPKGRVAAPLLALLEAARDGAPA